MENKTHVKLKVLVSLCVEIEHMDTLATGLTLSLSRKWPRNDKVGGILLFQVPKNFAKLPHPHLLLFCWLPHLQTLSYQRDDGLCPGSAS